MDRRGGQLVAVVCEHHLLVRVVRDEVHCRAGPEAEVLQDRDDPVVGAAVDDAVLGQQACGLDRVGSEDLLQRQRPQLEVEAHAATVLAGDVDDHPLADRVDVLHGVVQLLAAIARLVVEDLSGLAPGIRAHHHATGVLGQQGEVVVDIDIAPPEHVVGLPLVVDAEADLPEEPEGGLQQADAVADDVAGAGDAAFTDRDLHADRLHALANGLHDAGDLLGVLAVEGGELLGGEAALVDGCTVIFGEGGVVAGHDVLSPQAAATRRSRVFRNWNAARPSSRCEAAVTLTLGWRENQVSAGANA